MSIPDFKLLEQKALSLRQKTFEAFVTHGEAHLGGSFSMIEALITLYEIILRPEDKFILSKAHASYPLCILLQDKGLQPELKTHLEIDEANGIFATTGSLGHGLPIAVGMAMARKRMDRSGKIYVMLSDGECQEGTTWESALIAAAHKLDNLVMLIDYNKIQALSFVEDALPLENLSKKFEAFNWASTEVKDGHSFEDVWESLKANEVKDTPKVIILHTIKGKGIPEFENDPGWHARKIKDGEIGIGRKALFRK